MILALCGAPQRPCAATSSSASLIPVPLPATPSILAAVGATLLRHGLHAGGRIEAIDALELALDVQYACFHPARPLLYVMCSNGGVGRPGDRHALVVLRLDGARLAMAGDPVPLPFRPIHGAVDLRAGRLLVAYNRPAALTVHALDERGMPQPMAGPFTDPAVVGHFPHQVLPMPQGSGVLLVCRGDDPTPSQDENPGSLRMLAVDGHRASCTQVVAPNRGFGFGPRNVVFGPDGSWLQVVLERQNRLLTFGLQGSAIESMPRFELALLRQPEGWQRPQLAGAIELDRAGTVAYVVNRSHAAAVVDGRKVDAGGENSIVAVALDAVTGRPQRRQALPLAGLHARCIGLSPDGQWLVAAIRESSARAEGEGFVDQPAGLQCFRVQPDGRLEFHHHQALDDRAGTVFWAGFAPA
jgi:6-phosphogluconolactonase (cycloisomerase 2 family)